MRLQAPKCAPAISMNALVAMYGPLGNHTYESRALAPLNETVTVAASVDCVAGRTVTGLSFSVGLRCQQCNGSGQDPNDDETCARCVGTGWEPHAD